METSTYWALVESHLPALKEHARKIVYYVLRNSRPGSICTADDLLHDTLLKVGKSATSQAQQPDPDWFVKVCKVAMRNIAYDLLATVDSKRGRAVDTQDYTGVVVDRRLTPLEVLVKQDEEHALDEALYALHARSPTQAFVLLYSLDVDDFHTANGNCHASKAQELGISHTAYRQNIHQATKQLRKALNP